jgi:uncharacterized protein YjeT (DUF2065 family)
MTDSKCDIPFAELVLGRKLQGRQDGTTDEPSAQHDAVILEAARDMAREVGRRQGVTSRRRTLFPVSLAASVLLGIGLGQVPSLWRDLKSHTTRLSVPLEMSRRGGDGVSAERAQIPAEKADPAVWYRYIQELVFSGQTDLAEEHLRRFRELHPDFVYQP